MKEISAKELEMKLTEGTSMNIIDVREDEEVASGKIPGAMHIPLGELPDRLSEISKDHSHYLICHAGGRSARACGFLEDAGYNVTNIAGGMVDWAGKIE